MARPAAGPRVGPRLLESGPGRQSVGLRLLAPRGLGAGRLPARTAGHPRGGAECPCALPERRLVPRLLVLAGGPLRLASRLLGPLSARLGMGPGPLRVEPSGHGLRRRVLGLYR